MQATIQGANLGFERKAYNRVGLVQMGRTWHPVNALDRQVLDSVGLCESWFRSDELPSIIEALDSNGYWLEIVPEIDPEAWFDSRSCAKCLQAVGVADVCIVTAGPLALKPLCESCADVLVASAGVSR